MILRQETQAERPGPPHVRSLQSKAPAPTARGVGTDRRATPRAGSCFSARETLLRRCSGKLTSLRKQQGWEDAGVETHFQSRCWEGTHGSRFSAATDSSGLAPWAGSTQPKGAWGKRPHSPSPPPRLETATAGGGDPAGPRRASQRWPHDTHGPRKCTENFPRAGGKSGWPLRWLRPRRRMSPQGNNPRGQDRRGHGGTFRG